MGNFISVIIQFKVIEIITYNEYKLTWLISYVTIANCHSRYNLLILLENNTTTLMKIDF